jgi:hypothetical protein
LNADKADQADLMWKRVFTAVTQREVREFARESRESTRMGKGRSPTKSTKVTKWQGKFSSKIVRSFFRSFRLFRGRSYCLIIRDFSRDSRAKLFLPLYHQRFNFLVPSQLLSGLFRPIRFIRVQKYAYHLNPAVIGRHFSYEY